MLASENPSHHFEMYILRFGRHPVLIISVLFMLVFGLTVAFSVNVPMFSTLRFFEGFCLAGIILSLYVLSKSLSFLRFSMQDEAAYACDVMDCSNIKVSLELLQGRYMFRFQWLGYMQIFGSGIIIMYRD